MQQESHCGQTVRRRWQVRRTQKLSSRCSYWPNQEKFVHETILAITAIMIITDIAP